MHESMFRHRLICYCYCKRQPCSVLVLSNYARNHTANAVCVWCRGMSTSIGVATEHFTPALVVPSSLFTTMMNEVFYTDTQSIWMRLNLFKQLTFTFIHKSGRGRCEWICVLFFWQFSSFLCPWCLRLTYSKSLYSNHRPWLMPPLNICSVSSKIAQKLYLFMQSELDFISIKKIVGYGKWMVKQTEIMQKTTIQNRIPSDPWLYEKGIKCYTTSLNWSRVFRFVLFLTAKCCCRRIRCVYSNIWHYFPLIRCAQMAIGIYLLSLRRVWIRGMDGIYEGATNAHTKAIVMFDVVISWHNRQMC